MNYMKNIKVSAAAPYERQPIQIQKTGLSPKVKFDDQSFVSYW